MPKSRLPIPDERNEATLADWVEATILVEARARYEMARIARDLACEEDEAENLLAEVRRRTQILGNAYPFREVRNAIEPTADPSPSYELLLLLSASNEYRARGEWDEANELFDDLVTQALAAYLGGTARGERFSTPAGGLHGAFETRVKDLAAAMRLRPGAGPWRASRKDGGVDAVAWRPFADDRTGFVAILAQCTVRTEWEPKVRDIVANQWQTWVSLGKEPITALAIPFVVPLSYDPERWDEHRHAVNVVFDRIRICEVLADRAPDNEVEIELWTERELDRNRL